MSFSLEVGDRSEDATGDHIALDPGEPQLDLVEPGRVGRGVVQMDVGMIVEKRGDALGFVRREIVADDMDLPAPGLVGADIGEEGHELGAGVTRRRLAENFAGSGVERGVEGQRAVAVILEAMALSSRPGESGSTGSGRSRAWIAVFSSTQNTAACAGGLR